MDVPPVPMLAVAGPLPTRPGWGYEVKWDGMRLLLSAEAGKVRLWSRQGTQYHASYPELADLGDALGQDAVVDGEVIALDETGRPSFALISQRMRVRQAVRARRLARQIPVTFMIFDLLELDGTDLRPQPYSQRRELLVDLDLAGRSWAVPPMIDDGDVARRSARAIGAEGIVAKRLDSRYQPGRSHDWVKIKDTPTVDVAVGGYVITPSGRLTLLVGEHGIDGLEYRGRVNSGTGRDRDTLLDLLDRHTTKNCPFIDAPRIPDAHWTHPDIVVEVELRELTPAGHLRHATYIRHRPDKTAGEL